LAAPPYNRELALSLRPEGCSSTVLRCAASLRNPLQCKLVLA